MKSKKPAKKSKKSAPKAVKVSVRQIAPRADLPRQRVRVGADGSVAFNTAAEQGKQIVRVIRNCVAEVLVFDTVEDVNAFLFGFDQENHGKDPAETGTWIDLIITHVQGDVFDVDQLEA